MKQTKEPKNKFTYIQPDFQQRHQEHILEKVSSINNAGKTRNSREEEKK